MNSDFASKHPNHCTHCNGWGYFVSSGCSVPYGEGSVNLPDEVDPCPFCVEKGRCPHCLRVLYARNADLSEPYCPNCGWDETKEDGIPYDDDILF